MITRALVEAEGLEGTLLETGLDSYAEKMKKNDHGTVDVHFAPKPPEGQERNWITTMEGKPFLVLLRFYGPKKSIVRLREGRQ